MSKIVVLAAMAMEIPKCLKDVPQDTWQTIGQHSVYVATSSGIGRQKAKKATERICEDLRPDLIIFLGFCGALKLDTQVGDIFVADRLSYDDHIITLEAAKVAQAERTLEHSFMRYAIGRFQSFDQAVTHRAMVKSPEVIGVEMEAHEVARVASLFGVPILAFKAVSDIVPEHKPWPLPVLQLIIRIWKNRKIPVSNLNTFVSDFLHHYEG